MRSRFKGLLPRLQEASTERNQVLHAFWAWGENGELYALRMGARQPNTGENDGGGNHPAGRQVDGTLGKDFSSFASAFLRARGTQEAPKDA